jgi:ABC-2 type transport system ATP-binding protein
MSKTIINVYRLTKKFGNVNAVNDISFDVGQGATVGLLGGNGAGKTTTLGMLLGLLLPSSGAIKIFGEDMVNNRHRVLPWMNFSSPYVDLPHRLTVRENLTVYGHLYGLPKVQERVKALAHDFNLTSFLDRPAGKLSAGQKTRVALAKALINEPRLLLLDEPTASMDPDTADIIREYLENYRRNRNATIILASHNMAEVERLCDNLLILKSGEIIERGAPKELINHSGKDTLEEVFLDIVRSPTTSNKPKR